MMKKIFNKAVALKTATTVALYTAYTDVVFAQILVRVAIPQN